MNLKNGLTSLIKLYIQSGPNTEAMKTKKLVINNELALNNIN